FEIETWLEFRRVLFRSTVHGDIVIDALCEDIGVLKYKGYSVHQCPGGIVPDVRSAYGDASALHIPIPGQQLPRRGLAPAGGTHQIGRASCRGRAEVEVG